MVKFPQEETRSLCKVSRPWHGLYRIIDRQDLDVTVGSMPHRMDKFRELHPAHHSCPWYGTRRSSPGRPPKWVDQLLRGEQFPQRHQATGPENPEADKDNSSHSSEDIIPTTENSSHPEGGAEGNHDSQSDIVSSLPRKTPGLPVVSSGPASKPTSPEKEVANHIPPH